jgi:hypothetical protein
LNDHGIGRYRIAREFQLGVVVEPLTGDEMFTGMLAIPYLTKHGAKGIKFRKLEGDGAKCLQHDGQKARLYNSNAYFDAGEVIGIAEGEIDAITATKMLGVPTMGLPGADTWKSNNRIWAPIFKNFPRVLVFTDGDKLNEMTGKRPGEELGRAIRQSLGWRVRIIACPEGEDVSSMVATGRQDELIKQFGDDDDGESADMGIG